MKLIKKAKKNWVFRIIYYWLPAFVWMGIIYYLSSQQKLKVSDEFTINFLIFKSLHVIEYAVLYFLLFRGFYSVHTITQKQQFIYPFIAAILYAISDELHQTFVPTREGHPRDIMIDILGIYLSFSYTKKYLRFLKIFL